MTAHSAFRQIVTLIRYRSEFFALLNAVREDEKRTAVISVNAPYIYLRSVLWASGDAAMALKALSAVQEQEADDE